MISNIQIRNFKAFVEEDFNILPLTVFTGMNGVGKSTLIQSLLLLRQSFQKNMFPIHGLALSGSYLNLGKGKDVFSINPKGNNICINIFGQNIAIETEFAFSPDTDLQPILEGFPKFGSADDLFTPLFRNGFQYLNAERLGPAHSNQTSYYDVDHNNSIGNKGEYAAHYLAKFSRKPIELNELLLSTNNNLLEQASKWFSAISPGIDLVAELNIDFDIARVQYRYSQGKDLTSNFSSVNVGFGFTYVLPIIVSILKAKKGDLILIENPESHLHPKGQAIIGQMLGLAAQAGVQLIIETHSDHVINGIRVAIKENQLSHEKVQLYYVERDKESKEHQSISFPITIDKTGELSNYPKGFMDEWAYQLSKLI